MSPDLPFLIDPVRLAASGKQLLGQVELTEMPRLQALVLNHEGNVKYTLAFNKDEHGVNRISGEVSAELKLLCQRCLEEMILCIANPVNIGFITSKEQISNIPDFVEPYISETREIALAGLIEEEIILGLPLSPLHNPEDCPALKFVQKHAVKRENPFAILKDVRSKK